MADVGSRAQRIRVPLALVVSRYFLYVLVGALLVVGIPAGTFAYQMVSGGVLSADYGEAHLDETAEVLVGQGSFDSSAIPSAYRYARFDVDGVVLESDMSDAQLQVAQDVAMAPTGGVARSTGAGSRTFYSSVGLADGGRCVLCYEVVPQWADKGTRDALPNPQDLLVWATLSSLVLMVTLIALRAARVLTREMGPLVRAAEAVGRQDLDAPVGNSDVAEVDDVLRAVEDMRSSLKESLEAQREAERRSREQVAALAHDLKTPLTVALGNAELLAEDAVSGTLGADQAACARAIREAVLSMDAFVGRIVEASRGQVEALHLEPTDPRCLAGRLEGAVRRLVEARGVALESSRSSAFEDVCDAVSMGGTPPLWDTDALERAVLNLARNACDHAGGGHVTLSFSCDAALRTLSITVGDDGPGFSPEALDHGDERFFRGDASRANHGGPGDGAHFGLGLAIAADIASAHGGTLGLANRTDSTGDVSGAYATISLPLADPSAQVRISTSESFPEGNLDDDALQRWR